MSLEVGKELGNSLGKFIESDRRTGHSDQAKFMRIRVDLQLDKPLRRGGRIATVDGEKFWVSLKYERLLVFCFLCGRLGHDDKHCQEYKDYQNASRQYGDWLYTYGNTKAVGDKSRSTSSDGGGEGRFEDGMEGYIHTTEKISSTLVKEGSNGSSAGGSITGLGKMGERDGGSTKRTSAVSSEKKQVEETLRQGDYPARVGPTKINEDAYSLVGQKVQEEKEFMEVSSPIKPTTQVVSISKFGLGYTTKITGQVPGKKPKAKVQLKKIAREKGKAKELVSEEQLIPVGSKRTGKLIF